ncbi:hypothetical protein J1N35_037885 [Gossypium stocksii]|uniref:Uncharacterized protein n=1 Tax=Gossypium stocksii TaxID=47602 RepID=A0A9D3ZLC3_9ROSI|nr:hypothetical protein J1N35_037885 [Gossypium stocksii]
MLRGIELLTKVCLFTVVRVRVSFGGRDGNRVVMGIRLSNFAFAFDAIEGERWLSDTEEGFLLPLHLLEAGFHLSLHPFFCTVLREYEIAPR